MRYTGRFNLDLLHEELFFLCSPDPIDPTQKRANYRITILSDDALEIDLDDENNRSQVDQVVSTHDYAKKSKSEEAKEKKEADVQDILSRLGITKEELKLLTE